MFIQERKYLKNATPKTLTWDGDAFKALEGVTYRPDTSVLPDITTGVFATISFSGSD